MNRFRLLRLNMSNYWRYLFMCCLISTVLANDNKEESTSAVVWVLLVLIFVIMLLMGVSILFLAIHINTRLKKIENRFSRRGSISSGHNHLKDAHSSIRSRNSRYENNPIKYKRRSRSPRNSPQPEQQQYRSAHDDQYFVSNMNTVYSNLRPPSQEQQQLVQQPVSDFGASHPNECLYEVLPAEDVDATQVPPPREGTNEQTPVAQEQQQQQSSAPNDSIEDGPEDEPMITPSYTTIINSPDTVTETVTDTSTQEIEEREYSEVPTPPTPNKNERTKVVKKGKRPQSSDEYTDPTPNGVAQMKRIKSSSMKQSPSSSPTEPKQRRASESTRPGFENWSIKSAGASTRPTLDESSTHPTLNESNV